MQWGCRLLKIWEKKLGKVMGNFKYRKKYKKIESINLI